MRGKLKRFIEFLNRERNGITGLETAIILIAFVVVASVFAYTVLSAGIFSSQKAQEAIHSGMDQSRCALEIKGSVVALGNTTGPVGNHTASAMIFTVATALKGTAIDLTPPTDANSDGLADAGSTNIAVIEYHSSNEVARDLVWSVVEKGRGDGDYLLETGEKFEVTVNLTGIVQTIAPYSNIVLEVKPATGAVLIIEKTMPGKIDNVMLLY